MLRNALKHSFVCSSPLSAICSLQLGCLFTRAARSPQGRRPLAMSVTASFTTTNPESYKEQLKSKKDKVQKQFAQLQIPDIEVFESKREHYRLRAEFRVWHEAGDAYFIMFEKPPPGHKGAPPRVRVDQFPVASELLNELMALLMQEVRKHDILKTRLYQANFHTTLSGQAMVTLIYHKKLEASWTEAAKQLREVFRALAKLLRDGQVHVIGRSKKQKVQLDQDYVIEQMSVDGKTFIYKQVEGAFSQPNGHMCQHMLTWARDVTRHSQGDLLELYCGNGNFTVALAENFRRAIATEVSKTSVAAALHNMKANDIDNILFARMSSEEFTQAWKSKRAATRLQGLKWDEIDMQTILVDPPRAGLDEESVKLLSEFQNVVYISCNPDTLLTNLQQIAASHRIQRFAVFDQFPYTDHLECGVYLTKR